MDMKYKDIIDQGFKEKHRTKVLLDEDEAKLIYEICVNHFLKAELEEEASEEDVNLNKINHPLFFESDLD